MMSNVLLPFFGSQCKSRPCTQVKLTGKLHRHRCTTLDLIVQVRCTASFLWMIVASRCRCTRIMLAWFSVLALCRHITPGRQTTEWTLRECAPIYTSQRCDSLYLWYEMEICSPTSYQNFMNFGPLTATNKTGVFTRPRHKTSRVISLVAAAAITLACL